MTAPGRLSLYLCVEQGTAKSTSHGIFFLEDTDQLPETHLPLYSGRPGASDVNSQRTPFSRCSLFLAKEAACLS